MNNQVIRYIRHHSIKTVKHIKSIRIDFINMVILLILFFIIASKEINIHLKLNHQDIVSTHPQQDTPLFPKAKPIALKKRFSNKKQKAFENYVQKYAPIAIIEMQKYNIPASITLAQGLHESNAGNSKLATKNNNHFGIKCFSKKCKRGHCSNFEDDSHKDFFKVYPSAEASYRSHSIFLQKDRYKHLQQFGNNYKAWASGLSKAGYATDKKYAQKLIDLIEIFELYKYDE